MSTIIAIIKFLFVIGTTSMIIYIGGYFLNLFFKKYHIRKLVATLFGVLLIVLSVLNVLPYDTLYYIFCGLYLISIFAIIKKDINFDKQVKENKFISVTLDRCWACVYSNVIVLILIPLIVNTNINIPFININNFLYIFSSYFIFLIYPLFKINKLASNSTKTYSEIIKNKILTRTKLLEIIKDIYSEESLESSFDEFNWFESCGYDDVEEYFCEILNSLQEEGKVLRLTSTNNEYMYVESEIYNTLNHEIQKLLEHKSKITLSDIVNNIDVKVNPEDLKSFVEYSMYKNDNWLCFTGIYLTKNKATEIAKYIDDTNINSINDLEDIAIKYSISDTVILEIIRYFEIDVSKQIVDKLYQNTVKHNSMIIDMTNLNLE